MDAFFSPSSIAVIGASNRNQSIGQQLIAHLNVPEKSYELFAVNPNYSTIASLKSYRSITQITESVDLAIIAIASKKIPKILEQCGKKGVKAVLIVAAGFREIGIQGASLEQEIIELGKRYKMRLLGTHSLGYVMPHLKLNASFFNRKPQAGNIAFISQSGALCNAILDWSAKEKIGFSAFVSLGTMIDVEWADIISYLGDDYRTKALLLYMESVGEARRFMSAAREVAFSKPIILIKAGRTQAASYVAVSHSGKLPGDDTVLDAAFKRVGILRVERIAELFLMASVLSKQAIVKGNRLAIVTNAGGPAILATDILLEGNGQLADFSEKSETVFKQLPNAKQWDIANPLDIQYQATADDFGVVVHQLALDRGNDGVLVIVSPQLHCSAHDVATRLAEIAQKSSKPIFVSILGETDQSNEILVDSGVPAVLFPDAAVRMFNYMWRYAKNLKSLYETPSLPEVFTKNRPVPTEINKYLLDIRATGRTRLSEWESGQVLRAYGMPIIDMKRAFTIDEAVAHAQEIGFPVVLKLHSKITHKKSELGGVKLYLKTAEQVSVAFEEIRTMAIRLRGKEVFEGVLVEKMHEYRGIDLELGSKTDDQFGAVLFMRNGGRIIELYKDQVVGLPPLNTTLAHRVIEQTKIYHAAKNNYNLPKNLFDRIEQFLVRFSHLVVEQPLIKQIELYPIAVSMRDILILDAEMDLHEGELADVPKLAIRPYPYEYEENWTLKTGEQVWARPIRPDDEPLVVEFHKTLSDQSVYLRYFYAPSFNYRVSHERLSRICFVDYDREMAVVVLNHEQDSPILLAAGRTIRLKNNQDAEFALTVADHYHGTGLGTKLLEYLIRLATKEGLQRLVADILPENAAMLHVCKKLGFTSKFNSEDGVMKVCLELNPTG